MTRQDEFKKELLELVTKYDIEITLEDDAVGYCPDYKISFYGYATDAIIHFGCTYIDSDGIVLND